MFWLLLLSHLLADYPMQTDWMVQAKRTWPGLTLHVTVHFVVMLLVTLPTTGTIWLQLLALAGLHFAIDSFKNFLTRQWPNWIVGPYFFDQFLHILSILLVAAWIQTTYPVVSPALPGDWAIYAIGYLLVTHVWFVTERVLVHDNGLYRESVQATVWPRMILRAGLLTVAIPLVNRTNLAAAGIVFPTLSTPAGRRAWLIDLAVVASVLLFLRLALNYE